MISNIFAEVLLTSLTTSLNIYLSKHIGNESLVMSRPCWPIRPSSSQPCSTRHTGPSRDATTPRFDKLLAQALGRRGTIRMKLVRVMLVLSVLLEALEFSYPYTSLQFYQAKSTKLLNKECVGKSVLVHTHTAAANDKRDEIVTDELRTTRERNRALGYSILHGLNFFLREMFSTLKWIVIGTVVSTVSLTLVQTKKSSMKMATIVSQSVLSVVTWVLRGLTKGIAAGFRFLCIADIRNKSKKGGVEAMKSEKNTYLDVTKHVDDDLADKGDDYEEVPTSSTTSVKDQVESRVDGDREVEEEQYMQIFCALDVDGDGFVSLEELRNFMVEKWGTLVSDKDVQVMMEEADLNDNKSLDIYEFMSVMRRAVDFKTTYAWRLFHQSSVVEKTSAVPDDTC